MYIHTHARVYKLYCNKHIFFITVNFASELSCATPLYGRVASQVKLI